MTSNFLKFMIYDMIRLLFLLTFTFFNVFFLNDTQAAMGDETDNYDFQPKVCDKGKLVTVDLLGNEVESKTAEFCFDEKYTTLISKNCQDKCELRKRASKFKGRLTYSQMGTPGSWLCKALKGEAHGYYFIHKEIKTLIHLCKLGDDIISSEYLGTLRVK